MGAGTPWMNKDNLYVKYGTGEVSPGVAGDVKTFGPKRMVEIRLDLTTLASTDTIIDDNVVIPKGARIEEVEVEVETATTSAGAATVDVGLVKQTDRTTAISATGLTTAAAKATLDTAGKRLNLINGSTAAGASIGTTLADAGLITAKYVTAVWTAGVLKIRVFYYMP